MSTPQVPKVISCIDVTKVGPVTSTGIAYKDDNETYEEFLQKVGTNEKIIGFEFDLNTKRLGVILG